MFTFPPTVQQNETKRNEKKNKKALRTKQS